MLINVIENIKFIKCIWIIKILFLNMIGTEFKIVDGYVVTGKFLGSVLYMFIRVLLVLFIEDIKRMILNRFVLLKYCLWLKQQIIKTLWKQSKEK